MRRPDYRSSFCFAYFIRELGFVHDFSMDPSLCFLLSHNYTRSFLLTFCRSSSALRIKCSCDIIRRRVLSVSFLSLFPSPFWRKSFLLFNVR